MLLQQLLLFCWNFPARKAEGDVRQAPVAQSQPSTHNQSLPHQHLHLNSRAEVRANSPFHSLHCVGSRDVANRPRQRFKWLHQNSAKLFCDSTNSEHADDYSICTLHQTHMEGTQQPGKRHRKHFKKMGIKKREDIKPNHVPPVSPSQHAALLLLGWGHGRTPRVLNRRESDTQFCESRRLLQKAAVSELGRSSSPEI